MHYVHTYGKSSAIFEMNRAWRTGLPEKVDGPRAYALMHSWLAHQGNQCTRCGKPLDKRDVQQLLVRLVGRLQNTIKGAVTVSCRTCGSVR